MEITQITDLITNVGFPIFCVIMLFKQNGELQNTLKDISATMQGISARLDNLEEKINI